MITLTHGNLLESRAEAFVNTVNTVGVMGKGIALAFKKKFPENFRQYEAACRNNQVRTGKMFITCTHDLIGPQWIVNFPTKQHWRNPSRMEWIVAGLRDLRHFLLVQEIQSIAIPALGCANGGLNWPDVFDQIELALGDLILDIQVFEPVANPALF